MFPPFLILFLFHLFNSSRNKLENIGNLENICNLICGIWINVGRIVLSVSTQLNIQFDLKNSNDILQGRGVRRWRGRINWIKAFNKLRVDILIFHVSHKQKLFTKYLRQTLVFMSNSAPREKFNIYFSRVFS